MREGLRFSYSHHRLRFYIPVGTSVWLLLGLVGALEPLFSRDVLGTGPEAIGWVSSIVGIGLVGGTLLAPLLPLGGSWGQRRRRPRGLDGLGRSSTSALASSRWWPWGFMWGSIIGTFAPIVRTPDPPQLPEGMVGRITGTVGVHSEAGKLRPLVFAPALAVMVGVQPALAVSGLRLTAIAAAVWPARGARTPPAGRNDRRWHSHSCRTSRPARPRE